MTAPRSSIPLHPAPSLRAKRIPELDALRGFVAMLVVVHHLFVIFQPEWSNGLLPSAYRVFDFVQARNKLAVLTFFVLSGYAIGLATRSNPPVTRAAIGHYAFRRVARIVPLYAISLVWTAALGLIYGCEGPAFSLRTLLGNAVFLQTSLEAKGHWFEPFGCNGPYWSLSYEVFFYLILPMVLVMVRRAPVLGLDRRGQLLALGILALLISLVANQVAPSPFSNFLGLWIVWLIGYVAVGLEPSRRTLLLVVVPVILTGLGTFVLLDLGRNSATLTDAFSGTMIGLAFALAAIWKGWDDYTIVRSLRRAFAVLFGRIGDGSYALYLLHYPLLLAVRKLLGPTDAKVLGAVCLLALLPLFVLLFCPWLERESGAVLHRLRATRPTAIPNIEPRDVKP